MAATVLSPRSRLPIRSARPVGLARPRPPRLRRDSLGSAMLAGLLLLVASLAAPDRPMDHEVICQRQNGVDACRVW